MLGFWSSLSQTLEPAWVPTPLSLLLGSPFLFYVFFRLGTGQEHENRFWTILAFCFSGALVFVHDSPVAVGQWSPVLGFLLVMVFTFSVHSYDRQVGGKGPCSKLVLSHMLV